MARTIPGHRPQPETGGCPTNRGYGRHTKLWRRICILRFTLCVVKMIPLVCLKIQGGDVSSIMFTSSASDQTNLIPKSTVPYKQLILENSPDKTRESCPLQSTTFCDPCNAASVKYLIQISKKNLKN